MRCRFLTLLIILFLALPASAHIFRLHSNETSYEPGDEILIALEVKNTLNVEKRFDIYVTLTEDEGRYPPMAKSYSINLSPSEEINLTIYNTSVSEFLSNGNYTVYAQLIEDGVALYEDYLYFSISGLPEEIDLYLFSSNRSDFSITKDVFIIGEKVYLGYNSSVDNISMDCTLVYPDNHTQSITLPFGFVPTEAGVYKLVVNATREGFKDFDTSLQFAVIKGAFSTKGKATGQPSYLLLLAVIIAVILIAIVLIVTWRGKR